MVDSGTNGYVECLPTLSRLRLTVFFSGVMLLFILSPPVPYSHRATSTTSVTLAIVTLPSSIAPPTPQPANSLVFPTSKRPQMMKRNASRKMNTGRTLTRSKRTVSAADAAATLTLSMSKESTAAVSTNGLMWPVAGLRHKSQPLCHSAQCSPHLLASLSSLLLLSRKHNSG